MLWTLVFLLAVQQTSLVQSEKVVRVIPGVEAHLDFLRGLDKRDDIKVDFWKAPSHLFRPVDIEVSDDDFATLSTLLKEDGIAFNVQIDDVQKLIDDERAPIGARSGGGSWHSKYHNLQEIVSRIREVSDQNAYFVKLIDLGRSHEGRRMQALKINGRYKRNKPVFFIECGIHAREWVSPATCMYMIDQMTQKYGNDQSVTDMLDKMDFIVLPVVNVDGYAYTWTPGNRMWRKNRRYHKYPGCYGTDLNRNWAHKWGGQGASDYHCDSTYRGDNAFSEVETRNIRDYLIGLGGKLKGFIDFHAYSEMWFTPWGYTSRKTRHYYEQVRVAKAAADALRSVHGTAYQYGSSAELLYPAAGGSEDWTYAVLGVTYSFSVELRDTGRYGFLLPANQIIPTGEETFEGLKALVKAMRV